MKKKPWRAVAATVFGAALAGGGLVGAALPAQAEDVPPADVAAQADALAAFDPMSFLPGPGSVVVAAGATPGSGTVSVLTEATMALAGQATNWEPVYGLAIGDAQYLSASANTWPVDHVETTSFLGLPMTHTITRWDFAYTCVPAGTTVYAERLGFFGGPAEGLGNNVPAGVPTTVPDNGPLPAECGGGNVDPQPSAPEASLAPQSGEAGSTFTVTGKGFPANAPVFLSWDEAVATLGTATPDAEGNFSVALTVPSGSAVGAHSVLVLGEQTITLPFTVTAASAQPTPTPSLTPQSGPAGSAFTVNGTGYLPGSSVTVSFGEAAAILGTVEVAADGTFAFHGTVPQDAASGAHTVYVLSHESGSQELTFTVGTPGTDPGNGGEDPGTDPGTDPGHNGGGHNGGHDGNGHSGDWHGGDVVGDGHDGGHGGNNADTAADIDHAATAGNGAITTDGSQDAATADRGLNLQTAVEHPAAPWLAAAAGLAALAAGAVLFLRRRNAG